MNKLTKERFQKVLFSHILSLSEHEIRFTMNIMGFTVKEFKQCTGRVEFEIHYRRVFIMKAEMIDTLLILSNPWIIFNSETNETFISLPTPPTFVDFISLFFTMCGDSLLKEVNYSPGYIQGFSMTDGPEEAKEYWEMIRQSNLDLQMSRDMAVKDVAMNMSQPKKKKIYS